MECTPEKKRSFALIIIEHVFVFVKRYFSLMKDTGLSHRIISCINARSWSGYGPRYARTARRLVIALAFSREGQIDRARWLDKGGAGWRMACHGRGLASILSRMAHAAMKRKNSFHCFLCFPFRARSARPAAPDECVLFARAASGPRVSGAAYSDQGLGAVTARAPQGATGGQARTSRGQRPGRAAGANSRKGGKRPPAGKHPARRRNSHQSSGTKTLAAGNEGSPAAQQKQTAGQQGTDAPPAPRDPEGKLGRGRADSAGGTKRAQKSGPQAARRTEQQGREAPPGAGPAPQTNRRKKRGGRPGEGGKGGGARRGAAGRRSPLPALCLIILRKIFHRGSTTMCM